MKKTQKFNIFLIILMIFSFFFIKFNDSKILKAENNYNIQIQASNNLTLNENVYSCGYKDITFLTFTAQVYNKTAQASGDFVFEWKDVSTSDKKTVSETATLTLNKIVGDNIIKVGATTFEVTAKSNSDQSINCTKTIIVDVKDDASHQLIITKVNSELSQSDDSYNLSNTSSTFTVSSMLAMDKADCTINWYLKTPSSSTFNFYSSGESCTITPSELINSKNGFGNYKLYASAQTSGVLYTSKIINFIAKANDPKSDANSYSITSKVINNSKAELEAFQFTLKNADTDCLDFNKIIWYVNNVKMGKGETFSYEPTTSETFTVSAKYQKANMVDLSETSITPKTTGSLKLIISICACVVVISSIFAIYVVRLNKKRDVVW